MLSKVKRDTNSAIGERKCIKDDHKGIKDTGNEANYPIDSKSGASKDSDYI